MAHILSIPEAKAAAPSTDIQGLHICVKAWCTSCAATRSHVVIFSAINGVGPHLRCDKCGVHGCVLELEQQTRIGRLLESNILGLSPAALERLTNPQGGLGA